MLAGSKVHRVYAFGKPVDMRKGFDGLYTLVQSGLNRDPLTGDMFLFVSKDRTRAKVLLWDGSGLCVYSKRLERGRFAQLWGAKTREKIELSLGELQVFFEGCELIGRMALSPAPMVEKSFFLSGRSGRI